LLVLGIGIGVCGVPHTAASVRCDVVSYLQDHLEEVYWIGFAQVCMYNERKNELHSVNDDKKLDRQISIIIVVVVNLLSLNSANSSS